MMGIKPDRQKKDRFDASEMVFVAVREKEGQTTGSRTALHCTVCLRTVPCTAKSSEPGLLPIFQGHLPVSCILSSFDLNQALI